MCQMDILEKAKKCPHCQHFQSRAAMFFYSPAFPVAIALIVFVVLIAILQATLLDRGEQFQQFAGQVTVTDSKIEFGERKDGPIVAVIGTMRNDSEIPWQEVRFQVDFKDAAGKVVDTGQKHEYSFYIPAKESLPIKLSFRREFPETVYASQSVRVVSAKDARSRW
jgi:hypothetical protein